MRPYSENKETKRFRWLAWFLAGLVVVYIVCALSLTENHTFLGPFYNCGEVSEVSNNSFRSDIEQEMGHQEASGTVVLDEGFFQYTIEVTGYSDAWNYLCVRVNDLSVESFTWQVTYTEIEDEKVTGRSVHFYHIEEGMNLLSLPHHSFNQVQIDITGDDGCSFSIGSMQFRENPPVFRVGKVVTVALITMACYIVLSGGILFFRRRLKRNHPFQPYYWIDALQGFYLVVAKGLRIIPDRFPVLYRRRRILRKILFLFIFCYNMYVAIGGNADYYAKFRFHILVYSLALVAIAVLSIEKEPSKKNWNNPLVWGWFVTAIMTCVSDFIYQKTNGTYRFFGYALIFVIGFFIFLWNNMEDQGELIEDFVKVLHVFFGIIVIYCILFRPENGAIRYSGFVGNPSVFGLYLTAIWAVVLGELEHLIRTKAGKGKLFLYVVEGCVVLAFAWKAQSVGPLLCIVLLAIIWLVRMIRHASREKARKTVGGVLICALVLILPVNAAVTLGIRYVPEKLGTEIAYETEVYEERIFWGNEVYAADLGSAITESRVGQKLFHSNMTVTSLTSSRNYYYKRYLRELNLFGHDRRPEMWGARRFPHNGILGMAYYYGIFTVVPYTCMLIATIVRTRRVGKTKIKYAAVPFFISLAFIVTSMSDNVEQPFYRLSWIGMYLLMGCAFCNHGEDAEPSEKE